MKQAHGMAMAAIFLIGLAAAGTAAAGNVWYRSRDGATTGYFESASNLQEAITAAQGGTSGTGAVKISGDFVRTNAAWGQLDVSAGGGSIVSGGWNWPGSGAEPIAQTAASTLIAG